MDGASANTRRVIAYTLLCGYSPFRSDDKAELVKETTRGKISFHERYWKKVSDTGGSIPLMRENPLLPTDQVAKDFIRGMLQVDPKKRMSAHEALLHPVSLLKLERDRLEVEHS